MGVVLSLSNTRLIVRLDVKAAFALIDIVAKADANAVKLQTFFAEEPLAKSAPKA